jgi:chaperonin GroEL
MPENTPKVILAPQARSALKSGFDQMAKLLAVSLGPTQGIVFHTEALKPKPEPLNDAATIARRMTALPGREQDVGAMLMRSLAWRAYQRVGDGSALTAVLAQAILEEATRYVAAGANPVRVQDGIEKAAAEAIMHIRKMAEPVKSPEELAAAAYTATREPDLSYILGEMFSLLGKHAHIRIENYMAPYLEREYIDGGLWEAKLISPHLLNTSAKAIARNCNVALYHGNLENAEQVLPLIKILSQKAEKDLLLIAHKISGQALNTLAATYVQNKDKLNIVAVDLIRAGEKALGDLQDLAALTGARLFNPEAGDRLESIRESELGFALRAEAKDETLLVSVAKNIYAASSKEIDDLQKYLDGLAFDDEGRGEIEMRLGRLSGSMGILKVGAYTQNERDLLRQKSEQGLKALHAALRGGLVPGGGTAFLHCIAHIEQMNCADDDERLGYRALARALRKPFGQILANAKIENPGRLAHEISSTNPGLVFDIYRQKTCQASEAGILDCAETLVVCLETAASGAQMALSTDVIVLKRNPRISYNPG